MNITFLNTVEGQRIILKKKKERQNSMVSVYPQMTSFSDPKGIIHTVTMFHITAGFL